VDSHSLPVLAGSDTHDENRYFENLDRRSALPNTDVQIRWKNVAGFSKPAAFSA
jgi:hypothetical protein